MADDPSKTVRIKRDSRVAEDPRGRNVWVGRVEEPAELELVSTTALEKILAGGDGEAKVEIRRLAESGRDGLLARDAATGHYEIVGQEELRQIAETGQVPAKGPAGGVNVGAPLSPDAVQKAEALSLVSTMMLRKVIGADGKAEFVSPAGDKPKEPEKAGKDKFGGFDPYNKS
ncbi:MAG TPA: hypothetical protein VH856_04555 [Steroidobacteraceae bacterium]|jgi:hypothetical protein